MSDELDALQALADAATPGPWHAQICCSHGTWDEFDPAGLGFDVDGPPKPSLGRYPYASGHDARFVAACRSAIPPMIARMRELEAHAVELKARLAGSQTSYAIMATDFKVLDHEYAELEAIVRGLRTVSSIAMDWVKTHPQGRAVTRAEALAIARDIGERAERAREQAAALEAGGTCANCRHMRVRDCYGDDFSWGDQDEWAQTCRECIRHPEAIDAWAAVDPTLEEEAKC